MAIDSVSSVSSVGAGSGILTQDVLDQLRAADEAARITPITLEIANEEDKQKALKTIDATMTNFIDSINAIKTATLWDDRAATVSSGTSVEVSASSKTDVQDFTINVTTLATKQIEQSGSFATEDDLISGGAGQINININGQDFTVDYTATTTLKELKDLINTAAGAKVDATVVQVSAGDFRLFMSSVDTGTTQDITVTDISGTVDARLSTGMTDIQTGIDSAFTFNGQAITRTSNKITDLITGLTLTLKETGSSNVSIAQDRTSILEKFDSFVGKYNAAITELDKMTNPSTESEERGIFSTDSTIKGMKRAIENMIESAGGGVGSMIDYGFDIDKDGKMTLDKTVLETAMDDNSVNTQAFFSGGDFTKTDLSVVPLTGAFADMSVIIEGYTKFNATLDSLKDNLSDSISSLEDRKASATKRLDSRYEILTKQFIAYDIIINKLNSASSMFVQLANAQTTN
ncbi:MAG: flagellar filament capping protein FliD [Sulfurimonas sp.]|nr:flagellar filament capping protein FliD [Sulfurimonas sp.]